MARHPPDLASIRDQKALGLALADLRRRAGLTQPVLGERAGIGVPYLSQLENGHRGAGWHTVMRLLAALGSDLHELAGELDAVHRQRVAKR
jgi:transcriptional regulator with XRE-family HTH domain